MNGFRLLGIIVISLFVIVGGLLLLMMTICAFQGYRSGPRSIGAGLICTLFLVIFLVCGVAVIASLAKGIHSSEMAILNLPPPSDRVQKVSVDARVVPPQNGEESK